MFKTKCGSQEGFNKYFLEKIYYKLKEVQNQQVELMSDNKLNLRQQISNNMVSNYCTLIITFRDIVQIHYVNPLLSNNQFDKTKLIIKLNGIYNEQVIYQTKRSIVSGYGIMTKILTDCEGRKIKKPVKIMRYAGKAKTQEFNDWCGQFDDLHIYKLTLLCMEYIYYVSCVLNKSYLITNQENVFANMNKFLIKNILPLNNIDPEFVFHLNGQDEDVYTMPSFILQKYDAVRVMTEAMPIERVDEQINKDFTDTQIEFVQETMQEGNTQKDDDITFSQIFRMCDNTDDI